MEINFQKSVIYFSAYALFAVSNMGKKFVFLGRGCGGEPFVFKQRVSPGKLPGKIDFPVTKRKRLDIAVLLEYNICYQ